MWKIGCLRHIHFVLCVLWGRIGRGGARQSACNGPEHVKVDIGGTSRCIPVFHVLLSPPSTFYHPPRQLALRDAARFRLDGDMSESAASELVEDAVRWIRSRPRTDPSIQTVRMQVRLEVSFHEASQTLRTKRLARDQRLQELLRSIQRARGADIMDYEAMTGVYRALFHFVGLRGSSGEAAGPRTRGMEDADEARETATAMESVFPRTSLRSFLSHGAEERVHQAEELSRIVLGVRLYNWDTGESESAMRNVLQEALERCEEVLEQGQAAVDATRTTSNQYADVLRAPRALRQALEQRAAEPALLEEQLSRWARELANRRQLLSSLESVMEEVGQTEAKLRGLATAFREELDGLQAMMDGRATVPRKEVYPRFHTVGELWLEAVETWHELNLQFGSFEVLEAFIPPTICSLSLDLVKAVRAAARETGELAEGADDVELPAAGRDAARGAGGADKVVRLHLETSPELMELPLYLQGHCPVALVQHRGLLQAGDPRLGVLRWDRYHIVCSSESAMRAMEARPSEFHREVLARARQWPELIYLLHLQEYFPDAALGALVKGRGASGADAAAAVTEGATNVRKRDAGTDTPVHFMEKNIIPGYTFSEWELRRRALQMANLHKCATTSVQTDASHFRRDNDSQVFLPRDAAVQTGVERGTNPIQRRRFVAGLRGGAVPVPPRPGATEEERALQEARKEETTKTRAAVVNLTFEL